jgi:hypothetical protein
LRQLGKLAPVEHVVSIDVEPSEQRAEVAISRAAHGPGWTERPDRITPPNHIAWPVWTAGSIRGAWPVRITRTIRIARAVCIARAIGVSRTIRVTRPICIAGRTALALVAVARFSPALWIGIGAASSSIAAILKQVAPLIAHLPEAIAQLLSQGATFATT